MDKTNKRLGGSVGIQSAASVDTPINYVWVNILCIDPVYVIRLFMGSGSSGDYPQSPHGSGRAEFLHPALQATGFAVRRKMLCTTRGGGTG